jgi:hypothetical protein
MLPRPARYRDHRGPLARPALHPPARHGAASASVLRFFGSSFVRLRVHRFGSRRSDASVSSSSAARYSAPLRGSRPERPRSPRATRSGAVMMPPLGGWLVTGTLRACRRSRDGLRLRAVPTAGVRPLAASRGHGQLLEKTGGTWQVHRPLTGKRSSRMMQRGRRGRPANSASYSTSLATRPPREQPSSRRSHQDMRGALSGPQSRDPPRGAR